MSAIEEARKLEMAGSRIVALIGWRIPVEPIFAAGMVAITVTPDLSRSTPDADKLLSADESLETRALLQAIICGDLSFATLILFAPPFTKLSAMLEELRRADLVAKDIPPSYYFELAIQQSEENRAFAAERVSALAARVAAAAGRGRADCEAGLEEFISATNRVRRAAMALCAARRRDRPPSGAAVLGTMAKGDWLPPPDHAEMLEALEAAPQVVAAGVRMLVVSSSVLAGPTLHGLLEEEGGIVVGEDDIYGSCFARNEIIEASGNPLQAIADFYFDNPPPQRTSPESARRRWFHGALEDPSVSVVVIYAELPIWGWDVPAIRDAAHRRGKYCLTIEHDVRTPAGHELARAEIRRFVASEKVAES